MARRRFRIREQLLPLLLLLCYSAWCAAAADVLWLGGSGNWHSPAGWSTASVPGDGDVVQVTLEANDTLYISENVTITALVLQGDGVVEIASETNVSVSESITWTGGTLGRILDTNGSQPVIDCSSGCLVNVTDTPAGSNNKSLEDITLLAGGTMRVSAALWYLRDGARVRLEGQARAFFGVEEQNSSFSESGSLPHLLYDDGDASMGANPAWVQLSGTAHVNAYASIEFAVATRLASTAVLRTHRNSTLTFSRGGEAEDAAQLRLSASARLVFDHRTGSTSARTGMHLSAATHVLVDAADPAELLFRSGVHTLPSALDLPQVDVWVKPDDGARDTAVTVLRATSGGSSGSDTSWLFGNLSCAAAASRISTAARVGATREYALTLEVRGALHVGAACKLASANFSVVASNNVTVASDGQISAAGMGYAPGKSSGSGNSGTYGGTGGSHGGVGGSATDELVDRADTLGFGVCYDSAVLPVLPGAGGSASSFSAGGHGGGVLNVRTMHLRVDGKITVDGYQAPNSTQGGGGGAGGSLVVNATVVDGTGTLSARGGDGGVTSGWINGGAGGGGRIAAHVASWLFRGTVDTAGGEQSRNVLTPNRYAGSGTFYLDATAHVDDATDAGIVLAQTSLQHSQPNRGIWLDGHATLLFASNANSTGYYSTKSGAAAVFDSFPLSSSSSFSFSAQQPPQLDAACASDGAQLALHGATIAFAGVAGTGDVWFASNGSVYPPSNWTVGNTSVHLFDTTIYSLKNMTIADGGELHLYNTSTVSPFRAHHITVTEGASLYIETEGVHLTGRSLNVSGRVHTVGNSTLSFNQLCLYGSAQWVGKGSIIGASSTPDLSISPSTLVHVRAFSSLTLRNIVVRMLGTFVAHADSAITLTGSTGTQLRIAKAAVLNTSTNVQILAQGDTAGAAVTCALYLQQLSAWHVAAGHTVDLSAHACMHGTMDMKGGSTLTFSGGLGAMVSHAARTVLGAGASWQIDNGVVDCEDNATFWGVNGTLHVSGEDGRLRPPLQLADPSTSPALRATAGTLRIWNSSAADPHRVRTLRLDGATAMLSSVDGSAVEVAELSVYGNATVSTANSSSLTVTSTCVLAHAHFSSGSSGAAGAGTVTLAAGAVTNITTAQSTTAYGPALLLLEQGSLVNWGTVWLTSGDVLLAHDGSSFLNEGTIITTSEDSRLASTTPLATLTAGQRSDTMFVTAQGGTLHARGARLVCNIPLTLNGSLTVKNESLVRIAAGGAAGRHAAVRLLGAQAQLDLFDDDLDGNDRFQFHGLTNISGNGTISVTGHASSSEASSPSAVGHQLPVLVDASSLRLVVRGFGQAVVPPAGVSTSLARAIHHWHSVTVASGALFTVEATLNLTVTAGLNVSSSGAIDAQDLVLAARTVAVAGQGTSMHIDSAQWDVASELSVMDGGTLSIARGSIRATNATVLSDASFDCDGMGFSSSAGYSAGAFGFLGGAGGSHGGEGGAGAPYTRNDTDVAEDAGITIPKASRMKTVSTADSKAPATFLTSGLQQSAYDSAISPVAFGSGGGDSSDGIGGSGGGSLFINISGDLRVDGRIGCDGADGEGRGGGGGAGGTLRLSVGGSMSGSGEISVRGGDGGSGYATNTVMGGGGAGGRATVEVQSCSFGGRISLHGGTGYEHGASGTMHLRVQQQDTAGWLHTLLVDNNDTTTGYENGAPVSSAEELYDGFNRCTFSTAAHSRFANWSVSTGSSYDTSLVRVDAPAAVVLDSHWPWPTNVFAYGSAILDLATGTNLTVRTIGGDGSGAVHLSENTSLWSLDPEFEVGAIRLVVLEGSLRNATSTRITPGASLVVFGQGRAVPQAASRVPWVGNVSWLPASAALFGVFDFGDRLTVESGGRLEVRPTDPNPFSDSSTGIDQGGGYVTLTARTIAVQTGAAVVGDGMGYAGTAGLGAGESHVAGAGGGSHAGVGGQGQGGDGGAAYGNAYLPLHWGSGGGDSRQGAGGNGGGRITLLASTVDVNGTLSAAGLSGALDPRRQYHGAGGGAGGSILVDALLISGSAGTGKISVRGGDGTNSSVSIGGAGAGGRISLRYARWEYVGSIDVTAGNLRSATVDATIQERSDPIEDFLADDRALAAAGTVYWLQYEDDASGTYNTVSSLLNNAQPLYSAVASSNTLQKVVALADYVDATNTITFAAYSGVSGEHQRLRAQDVASTTHLGGRDEIEFATLQSTPYTAVLDDVFVLGGARIALDSGATVGISRVMGDTTGILKMRDPSSLLTMPSALTVRGVSLDLVAGGVTGAREVTVRGAGSLALYPQASTEGNESGVFDFRGTVNVRGSSRILFGVSGENGSCPVCGSGNATVKLFVDALNVEQRASIESDARGYAGASRASATHALATSDSDSDSDGLVVNPVSGEVTTGLSAVSHGSGGGHAGPGGGAGYVHGHGSVRWPTSWGAGGGSSYRAQGRRGGGAVYIVSRGPVELDGSISANGFASEHSSVRRVDDDAVFLYDSQNYPDDDPGDSTAGSGAGGSIFVQVLHGATFGGTGNISALGGDARLDGSSNEELGAGAGAGAGGRVAVFADAFEFRGTVSAAPGLQYLGPGSKASPQPLLYDTDSTYMNSIDTQDAMRVALHLHVARLDENQTAVEVSGPSSTVLQPSVGTVAFGTSSGRRMHILTGLDAANISSTLTCMPNTAYRCMNSSFLTALHLYASSDTVSPPIVLDEPLSQADGVGVDVLAVYGTEVILTGSRTYDIDVLRGTSATDPSSGAVVVGGAGEAGKVTVCGGSTLSTNATLQLEYLVVKILDAGTWSGCSDLIVARAAAVHLYPDGRACGHAATSLDRGACASPGQYSWNILRVQDGSSVMARNWRNTSVSVRVEANSIAVETGGSLSADAGGSPSVNDDVGATNTLYGGTGGTNGGVGYPGNGAPTDDRAPMALDTSTYVVGDAFAPEGAGAAGGVGPLGEGGRGGGGLHVVVAESFVLDGTLSARGASGSAAVDRSGAGGGAGGNVALDVFGSFEGSGRVLADGGDGDPSVNGSVWFGGGGGGGRVLVRLHNIAVTLNGSAPDGIAVSSTASLVGWSGNISVDGGVSRSGPEPWLDSEPATVSASPGTLVFARVSHSVNITRPYSSNEGLSTGSLGLAVQQSLARRTAIRARSTRSGHSWTDSSSGGVVFNLSVVDRQVLHTVATVCSSSSPSTGSGSNLGIAPDARFGTTVLTSTLPTAGQDSRVAAIVSACPHVHTLLAGTWRPRVWAVQRVMWNETGLSKLDEAIANAEQSIIPTTSLLQQRELGEFREPALLTVREDVVLQGGVESLAINASLHIVSTHVQFGGQWLRGGSLYLYDSSTWRLEPGATGLPMRSVSAVSSGDDESGGSSAVEHSALTFNTLSLSGASHLTGAAVALFASNVTVGANCSINSDGLGGAGEVAGGPCNGSSSITYHNQGVGGCGVNSGSGGGYGGYGIASLEARYVEEFADARLYTDSNGTTVEFASSFFTNKGGGQPYGNNQRTWPLLPGSGGGSGPGLRGHGSAGGGVVYIEAETIAVGANASISADGADALGSVATAIDPYATDVRRGGAGSGGSVLLVCSSLDTAATSRISADGGATNDQTVDGIVDIGHPGGPGGGGRIAIHCDRLLTPPIPNAASTDGSGAASEDDLTAAWAFNGTSFAAQGQIHAHSGAAEQDVDAMLRRYLGSVVVNQSLGLAPIVYYPSSDNIANDAPSYALDVRFFVGRQGAVQILRTNGTGNGTRDGTDDLHSVVRGRFRLQYKSDVYTSYTSAQADSTDVLDALTLLSTVDHVTVGRRGEQDIAGWAWSITFHTEEESADALFTDWFSLLRVDSKRLYSTSSNVSAAVSASVDRGGRGVHWLAGYQGLAVRTGEVAGQSTLIHAGAGNLSRYEHSVTTLAQSEVDAFVSFSTPLGSEYNAKWLDPYTLRISVHNATGATVARVRDLAGNLTVSQDATIPNGLGSWLGMAQSPVAVAESLASMPVYNSTGSS